MSRLIDKLNRATQTTPQPMGFTTTQSVLPKPKLSLIASLSQVNTDGPAKYVTGADGGLFNIYHSSEVQILEDVVQSIPDIPWGVWLKSSGQTELKQIV